MNKSGRESYAKSLLLRQKESQQPSRSQLWQEDATLYAKPIQPRPHGEGRADASAGLGNSSLPSAVPGPRPAPLQASAVSTSFMVAETGDEQQVSRGGTALSYGTAESSMLREHRHDAGGRTFVTASIEPAPEPAPPASLPIPVLWQLKAQPDEVDPLAEGVGALSASRAAESAVAMGRELRSINASRLQRVMGAVGETPARAALRKTRQARRHAEDVIAQVREREQVARDKRILKAHTRDPGADTRPLPKAGRRAGGGGVSDAVHPPREPWGGQAATLRKKEWDGEDAVLPSGPKAPSGFPVPLQYLELVRVGSSGSVPDLGATSTSSSLGVGLGETGETFSAASGGFRVAKPGLRYAGGGFAKTKPEREHTQEDYVELLRVAEVLDALNAVEGAVLQEHADDELMSYEQYLHTVMGNDMTTSANADSVHGHGGPGQLASEQELAAEVAAAVQAGQDSLAATTLADAVDGAAADAVPAAGARAAGGMEPVAAGDPAPVTPRIEVEVRSRPNSAASTRAADPDATSGPSSTTKQEEIAAVAPSLGDSELVGYLDGNRAPLEKPPQA
eukprot:COSAG02_NODE_4602_length_5176_cov_2.578885_3_plen_566_part_00